jgi:CubicO group peptidase (beta-lactamase class C family)
VNSLHTFIQGTVAPGFEAVAEAFRRNFVERGELGAACAVYHHGCKVVDLWGGWRDLARTRPWQEDTLVLVFSTTKGMASLALAVAHARGLLDYDEPIATYWPTFAQGGKGAITVRQLVSHQAGLVALDHHLTPTLLADHDAVRAVLERQRPLWQPGRRHGYHAFTLGLYEGALLRQADPHHRSLGRFFQEELAGPLGAEFYIGVPATVPSERIAELQGFSVPQMLVHLDTMPPTMLLAYALPGSVTRRSLNALRVRKPADFNLPDYRAVENPAGGGLGTARGIAQIYGAFATGGRALGMRAETLAALEAPVPPPARGVRDVVLKIPMRYGLGFLKPSASTPFGVNNRAYGAHGTGGSFGFADPEHGIGFAYTPNRLGLQLFDDPRTAALHQALYHCLISRSCSAMQKEALPLTTVRPCGTIA